MFKSYSIFQMFKCEDRGLYKSYAFFSKCLNVKTVADIYKANQFFKHENCVRQ